MGGLHGDAECRECVRLGREMGYETLQLWAACAEVCGIKPPPDEFGDGAADPAAPPRRPWLGIVAVLAAGMWAIQR